jgi:hypothetical protein
MFDSFYNTMVIMHGYAEKTINETCEKSHIHKALQLFEPIINESRQMRDEIKMQIDNGFDKFVALCTGKVPPFPTLADGER